MQTIKQKWIMRDDLQQNPNVMYLFGDNCQRVGLGGQAKEMRGEPNAIGVATKKSPTSDEYEYFTDDELFENAKIFCTDLLPAFRHVARGGLVVIPADGLGTGLSDMPNRCPESLGVLEYLLDQLEGFNWTYLPPNQITVNGLVDVIDVFLQNDLPF